MQEVEQLELEKHKNNLENVKNMKDSLIISIEKLKLIIENKDLYYKINDSQADGNYMKDLLDVEEKIYSDIVNVIIPSLQSKVDNIQIIDK